MTLIQLYLLKRPVKAYVNFNYAIQDVNESLQRFGVEVLPCSEFSRGNKKQLIELGARRVEIRLPIKNIQSDKMLDYHAVLLAIFNPQEPLEHSTWIISFRIETGDQRFFEPKIF